ncbi:MAG TPA: alpha/beta hydrolase-fold protein [Candidatus Sulfotelmatobacter sp.]|nr:alpha/beta hydrolase-fold protein [Candidatus Sulfotelmatobacter sp.]
MPAAAAPERPAHVTVRFAPGLGELHGRLLLFAARTAPPRGELEPSYLHPRAVEILGVEVHGAPAGSSIELPVDGDAYPTPWRALAPGRYVVRAELDVRHRYTYDGGQPGDPDSGNLTVTLAPGADVTVNVRARRGPEPVPPRFRAPEPQGARMETFVSPALSAFFGRPIVMRAYVVPPPGYDVTASKRYATAYVIGGYGTSDRVLPFAAAARARLLAKHGGTQLFYVYLDPHVPLGHSVFADSVNNGPWGRALTTELIPYLESRWPLRAQSGARFLTGHSSGGWTTMWLQTTYPEVFGGTWSTSPDPLDFHDFTGPNLVDRPNGNMYVDAHGKPYMLVRIAGKDAVPLKDYILQERALGEYGGQFGSFDAVFGPRGADGRPQPLFDRTSGQIDAAVARAWEAHYDIVHNLVTHWATLGPELRGKLHVYVGTWDTFHLEAGVHRLHDALAKLPGSDAQTTFVPHRTHFDLYQGPNGGLTVKIDRAMTAAAKASANP